MPEPGCICKKTNHLTKWLQSKGDKDIKLSLLKIRCNY
jgi:hypothetical protein